MVIPPNNQLKNLYSKPQDYSQVVPYSSNNTRARRQEECWSGFLTGAWSIEACSDPLDIKMYIRDAQWYQNYIGIVRYLQMI